jgi:transposase-like protein
MARPKKYPDELIERGVRLALESGRPIAHVAADLGMHPETLRKKVRQAQADSGARRICRAVRIGIEQRELLRTRTIVPHVDGGSTLGALRPRRNCVVTRVSYMVR